MGFMAARTSAPKRIAPKQLGATNDLEADKRTADDLFNLAQGMKVAAGPIEVADQLWGLADEASAALDEAIGDGQGSDRDGNDGPTPREVVEAKLGATVKAAMAAVATASSIMSQAKRVSKVDVPREVAKAVREAKADAMVAQLDAIEEVKEELNAEFERTIAQRTADARKDIKQEVIKLAEEKTEDARKIDRKKFRKDMEKAKEEWLRNQEQVVKDALAEQEMHHQMEVNILQGEAETRLKAAERAVNIIAAAAADGLGPLVEDVGELLASIDGTVEMLKEQEVAAQNQMDYDKALLSTAHTVMQRELTESLEEAHGETAAAIAAHQQQIKDDAKQLDEAVAFTRACCTAAKVRALKQAKDQHDLEMQQAADAAAEAQMLALSDAAQRAVAAQQLALREAHDEAERVKAIALAECQSETAARVFAEATEAANTTAQAASEASTTVAVNAARTAATFEAQAEARREHEVRIVEVEASWEERLIAAHEAAHQWAERAQELEVAEARALQQITELERRLASIGPVEVLTTRVSLFIVRRVMNIVHAVYWVATANSRRKKAKAQRAEQKRAAADASSAPAGDEEESSEAWQAAEQAGESALGIISSVHGGLNEVAREVKRDRGWMKRQATWNPGFKRSNSTWFRRRVGMSSTR